MYIFYNKETGIEETRMYIVMDEKILEDNDNWVQFNGEIPEKDGFDTFVKVVDGEVTFVYVPIPPTTEEILTQRIDELEMMILLGGDIL